MKAYLFVLLLPLALISCKEQSKDTSETPAAENAVVTEEENTATPTFNVTPISHATMVLEMDGTTIYVDPVGGAEAFTGQPKANLILITDIHGDHFNMETVRAITGDGVGIVAPKVVADKIDEELLPQTIVLNNGETTTIPGMDGFTFKAIAMYNLREEALKFHVKGRGNGYVIEHEGQRVYISGDTEDIPEMRNLENIDIAFVCMNLPYTMPVESAADAVSEFQPAKVYPYHYRGTEGLSDVAKFKELIQNSNAADNVEVVQLNWYPNREN
ncbi:MAG: MBL fold metallo-hydrolase [Marinirhabdus sp.]|nr:MBL fold metallo-hydrolase [Marinirhabdus sp.]